MVKTLDKIINFGKKATIGLALLATTSCATMNTNYHTLPPTQQK